jgi:hypothetical protein
VGFKVVDLGEALVDKLDWKDVGVFTHVWIFAGEPCALHFGRFLH